LDQKEFSVRLRSEVERFRDNFRHPSAAFLIWYLMNFFRIGEQDAQDSVCDKRGDKGIDGIWLDETSDEEEIYIFQSKFSPYDSRSQGDNDLRNFIGAKTWFASADSVEKLLASTANLELKSLVNSLRIHERVSKGCKVNAIFITNKIFDPNAKEYLEAHKNEIEGYDFPDIFDRYTYVAEEEAVHVETALSLANPTFIEYDLADGIKVNVFAIQAKELLNLEGIKDNSLFSRNVRYGLGRTRVNKDIRDTIRKTFEHPKIFLYHNGITIACERLERYQDSIRISRYSVVNGCQSMLTFYENADSITEDVFVLTKIIEIPTGAPVSVQDITYWTNNQNAISVRDLKANDVVQRTLQREFDKFFGHKVLYRRQKGHSKEGYDEVIERDFAAQLVAAFYLKEPNITYVRNRLFTDRYYDIFSIHTTPAKIYLANVIYEMIEKNANRLKFKPIGNYGLARFFMLHVIGELLRQDPKGDEILRKPEKYVKGKTLEVFKETVERLFQLLVFDIDNFIDDWMKEHDNFFDYKNFFKNSDRVKEMTQTVTTAYKKQLIHHPEDSFSEIFGSISS